MEVKTVEKDSIGKFVGANTCVSFPCCAANTPPPLLRVRDVLPGTRTQISGLSETLL